MGKKSDKTAGKPHNERMEVSGESTADISIVNRSIVSAASATYTSTGPSSSKPEQTSETSNAFESRMARLEAHIEKMTNVMSVHFGSLDDEDQDLHIPEEDDLGLPLGMQDDIFPTR